jgi:hypothetical protein
VGAALIVAARRPGELRLPLVLMHVAGMSLSFLLIHHLIGGPEDTESTVLYLKYGKLLLDTHRLPVAEYPPLALLAIGLATALGPPAVALPLLTLPIWLLGLQGLGRLSMWGPWAVAATTLWPAAIPFWELRFDAFAVGLFALALAEAWRERWLLAGVLLALGGCVKWYPLLAIGALALALLHQRHLRQIAQLLGSGSATIVAVTLPLAIVGPVGALTHPYTFQSARGISGESLPYTVMHLTGMAKANDFPWDTADYSPSWLAVVVAAQVVSVVGLFGLSWWRPRRSWATGALSPAVALLTNRIYSSQFSLVILASAAALLAVGRPDRRTTSIVVASAGIAVTAEYAIYPGAADPWFGLSVLSFAAVVVLLATAWNQLPHADDKDSESNEARTVPPCS